MVLKPAEFLVETVEAGLGEVLVYVEDPEGHTEEVGTHTLIFYSIKHNKAEKSDVYCLCPSGQSDPQQRQEQKLLCGLPAQSGGASQSKKNHDGRKLRQSESSHVCLLAYRAISYV